MPRGWLFVLSVFLIGWEPMQLAREFSVTLGSFWMRGPAAPLELLVHAGVAAVAVASGRALWIQNPDAPGLATIALAMSAARAVQSLYWSSLPGQTMPGDRLPLAIGAAAHAAGWIVYLRRSRRVRAIYPTSSSPSAPQPPWPW
jgi:hypothetical protein